MATGETVAWVDVLPSMSRWMPELNRGIGAAMPVAGRAAGAAYGSSFGTAAASGIQAASTKMAAALRQVQDSTGRVRVAEAQLQQVRASGRATDAQVIGAQERLSAARRAETAANERLHGATTALTAAQSSHTRTVRESSSAVEGSTVKVRGLHTGMLNLSSAVNIAQGAFFAFRTVGTFFGGTIKAASDLNEEINKSRVVFAGSAGSVLAWSKTTASSLGISQQQALASAGTFGNLFRAMGLIPQKSADMSTGLVKLASDLASFNNANPADVLEAMRAGLVGEMEPMRRYGVDLSDARLRQEALNLGIYSGTGILNSSQKAQAAYSLMLKQTTLAQGDFGRTSGGLANQQRILSAEWTNAKAQLGSVLMPALVSVTHWLTGSLIPAFQTTVGWVRQNITWLAPLAAAIAGIVIVVKAWQVAQALLNVVMTANPVGLIVTGLVVLGAALVTAYKTSATFRGIVTAAFDAVRTGATLLWRVLQPVFSGIATAWVQAANFVVGAWNRILRPAWNEIAPTLVTVWGYVRPIFSAIATAWSALVTGIAWAWDHILHPVWNVLAAIAAVLFRVQVIAIFVAVRVAWELMTHGIAAIWNGVLHPLWVAVTTIAGWMWNTYLRPIFSFIAAAWRVMATLISAAWNTIIKPAWNAVATFAGWLWNTILRPVFSAIGSGWSALSSGIRTVYDRYISPVFSAFGRLVNVLRDSFRTGVSAIAGIWNGLVDALKRPVQVVIDVVWNNGLRKLWNTINNIWGGHDLSPFSWANGTPAILGPSGPSLHGGRFADGGLLPGYTPGRDVHRFYSPTAGTLELSGGEPVLRPEAGAVLGRGWVNGINGAARRGGQAGVTRFLGGYASGGEVSLGGRDTGWASSLWDKLSWAIPLLPGGNLIKMLGDYIAQERSATGNRGGAPIYSMLGDLFRTGANAIWGVVKSAISTWSSGVDTATPASGATGPVVDIVKAAAAAFGWNTGGPWQALSWIISHESGWRPTAQNPTSTAYGLFQFLDSTWASVGGHKTSDAGLQATYGMRYINSRYGTPSNAQLFWMRHGYYDQGGILGPGMTGGNATSFDERVLSPGQTQDFHRLVESVAGGRGVGGTPVWHFYLGEREVTDLVDARMEYREDVRALDLRSSR